jgi:multiple sugar transport system permease protein
VILTDPVWWNDFTTTLLITVVTVAIELLLVFWFAFVMLCILRGRGPLEIAGKRKHESAQRLFPS